MVTKERKAELIQQFGGDPKNSGDTAAQIAILTERIADITEHLKRHPKDKHSAIDWEFDARFKLLEGEKKVQQRKLEGIEWRM